MRLVLGLLPLFLALLVSRSANAQALRGRVLVADSTAAAAATPVAGALVVAWSASGDTTRALASSTGRFRLALPRGGAYQVRVLRIGYAPSEVMTVTVPERGDLDIELRASRAPVRLDAVAVRQRPVCGPPSPDAPLLARVWDAARTAMFAVQLDAADEPLEAVWMEYERETDPAGRIVRTQQVRVVQQPTRQVFRSAPPESLVVTGFVVMGEPLVRYHAPDPQVLLSPEFTSTHCFALEPAGRDARTLVLRFEPAPSRSTVRDIAGAIRLDRATGALQRLDFSYTNLPEAGVTAGGSVEFTRLETGRWVVRRWRAQVPLLRRRAGVSVAGGSTLPGGTTLRSAAQWVATGVHSTGGEVVRIEHRGAVLLAGDVPQVRLALQPRDTLTDVAGVELTLAGTNLRATTDARGHANLGYAPPGRYRAQLSFPRLDDEVPPQLSMDIEVRTPERLDTIALPPYATLLRALCSLPNTARTDAGTGLLRGTVVDEGGQPAGGARVTVRYARVDARALRAGGVTLNDQLLELTTDERGRWRACGVPRGSDLLVLAFTPALRATWRGRIDADHGTRVVPLQLLPAVVADTGVSISADTVAGAARPAIRVRSAGDSAGTDAARVGGQHLTANDIARAQVEYSWQLLTRMTGVQLRRVNGGVFATASRGNLPTLQAGAAPCPMRVLVNGVALPARTSDGVDLSDLPPPAAITRLDVYPSTAEVPPALASSARGGWCGVVVVETR